MLGPFGTLKTQNKLNVLKIFKQKRGARDITQQLRALGIVTEDPGSIPRTHMEDKHWL